MGQPLELTVPVQLDDGERLAPECVSAEIYSGETRLASNQIRIRVQSGAGSNEWLAQISTLSPVEEPVLEVSISAGCGHRFFRRVTALADPPLGTAAGAAAAGIPQTARTDSPLSWPVSAAAWSGTKALPPTEAASKTAVPARTVKARKPKDSSGSAPTPRAARPGKPRALTSVPANAGVARLLMDVGVGPMLRMDIDEPVMSVATAASAGAGDTDELNSLGRLKALESSLAEWKSEAQSAKLRNQALQAQLDQDQSQARWMPWLLAGLGALALLALGLVWRLRQLRQTGLAGAWWNRQEHASVATQPEWSAAATDGLMVASGLEAPLNWQPEPIKRPDERNSGDEVLADLDEDIPPLIQPAAHTGLTPPERFNALGTMPFDAIHAPAREVSVEELLDLEQQADFFIALGQEEAAIDLLMAYLRSTGGLSPLPYTKLLEIYRRQGDRSAYERIRARFNRRFNVYAPDWDIGPQVGRWLEDYPDAIAQLGNVWASPLDAMAVLEGMLFRRDESQDLFDLPAYKDVLLMYSIARDLWQQGGGDPSEVDLLLPLGEVSSFSGDTMEGEDFGLDSESGELTRFELDLPIDNSERPDRPKST